MNTNPEHVDNKVRDTKQPTDAPKLIGKSPPERERLRDILVVFVTYPITPTEKTERIAETKPWLEFLSLLLKVGLAAYGLWEVVRS